MAVFIALASIADITQNALFGGTGRVTGRAGRCRARLAGLQCSGSRCVAAVTTSGRWICCCSPPSASTSADAVLTAGWPGDAAVTGQPLNAGQRRSRRPVSVRPLGPSARRAVRRAARRQDRPYRVPAVAWRHRAHPGRTGAADADRAKRSRPAAREKGSRLPGQATPAVGLGQPGILSAHHSNLLHARQPAMSAGNQQLSRRAEGPVRRDLRPWCTAPAARWADRDERARGRRGATGPDPRTAQSRSARSGDGPSRRLLPGTGSHGSRPRA